MNKSQKKLLFISIAVFMGLIIFLALVNTVTRQGKVEIEVAIAPDDAKLTIDDKITKPGKVLLNEGEHTFKVSRPPLSDSIRKINTKDIKGQVVYLVPQADTEEGTKWLVDSNNQKVQEQLQKVGDDGASQEQDILNKKYPYLNELPHESINFQIDYGLDPNNNISFQITLLPYVSRTKPEAFKQQLKDFKAEALEWLKVLVGDTSKYEITFTPDPDK